MRILMATCVMLVGGAERMAPEPIRVLGGSRCRFVVASIRPGEASSPALADALDRLLDEPALRHRLADAARRRAGRFSAPRMARTFLRLLRPICPPQASAKPASDSFISSDRMIPRRRQPPC